MVFIGNIRVIFCSAFAIFVLKIALCQSQDQTRNCKVVPLKYRNNILANTIFTGKILSFYIKTAKNITRITNGEKSSKSPRVSGSYAAKVSVRRVFRGERDRLETNHVIVEGLGNPKICFSDPKIGESFIFLTDRLNEHQFDYPLEFLDHVILRSSLLRLSMDNFRVLQKMHFEYLANLTTNQVRGNVSCEESQCGFGAVCKVPPDSGEIPYCNCEDGCQDLDDTVCGSDGITYENECKLRLASCKKQRFINAIHTGHCGARDPCTKLSCPPYSVCVTSPDGVSAVCQCQQNCTEVLTESDVVCGSNGQDFPSRCHFQRFACESRQLHLEVRYEGSRCNPCENFHCADFDEKCHVDSQSRKPSCVTCPSGCPENFAPVCANNGKTYRNDCYMNLESCQTGTQLRIMFFNDCKSEMNQCDLLNCTSGQDCFIDKDGVTECVCGSHCEPIVRPVCASNGVTFNNLCEMKRHSCEKNENVTAKYIGNCGSNGPCYSNPCNFNSLCVELSDSSFICECPECSLEYSPVCGSDGRTYNNLCSMRRSSCQREENIQVIAVGNCSICTNVTCDFYANCQVTSDGLPECICPKSCMDDPYKPVCGTDGNTYENECHLRLSACRKKQFIVVSGPRRCETPMDKSFLSFNDANTTKGNFSCDCNKLGTSLCDFTTSTCICLEGVTGSRCDRCKHEFWGMHKIKHGARGCTRCNCSPFGSVRSDCEQMSGRCVCKMGIFGTKCDQCPDGSVINDNGCVEDDPWGSIKSARHANFEELQRSSHPNQVAPVTTITLFGLIGDFCITDSDCQVLNSACSLSTNRCICSEGFAKVSEDDNRECIVLGSLENIHGNEILTTRNLCSGNPCEGGGTCEEHDGTFTCFCTSDRTGSRCERTLDLGGIKVASFNGIDSFVELMPLENVDHKLSIDMEFKSYSKHGVLLYAQQNSNSVGDYVSIAIVNGFLEFRYDLGTGSALIRSLKEIKVGSWHRVQARRWHKDGILKVDNEEDVVGESFGILRSLDIGEPTFVGGMPVSSSLNISKVVQNLGMQELNGLNGCIRRFKVGHREIKIQAASEPFSVRRVRLTECNSNFHINSGDFSANDNPIYETRLCDTSPCLNKGKCRNLPRSKFICDCLPGFSGSRCQEVISSVLVDSSGVNLDPMDNIAVPAFRNSQRNLKASEKSYLELPSLRHVSKAFHIEVWFLSKDPEGMLLYNGQQINGKGDFLSINLLQGHIQFRYDLGSGASNLTTSEKIDLNQWNVVRITRNGLKGTLQLNEGPVVKGASPGSQTELNLKMPLFIGGSRFANSISKASGISKGLNGAIQRLIVNGNAITDLVGRAKSLRGISKYEGPPCDATNELEGRSKTEWRPIQKCYNGGQCVPFFRSYVCNCLPDFTGKRCEKKINEAIERNPVKFEGNTFLKFVNSIGKTRRKSEKKSKFTVLLRTKSKNGLLLWTSQNSAKHGGDYMALSLFDGHPELTFNFASSSKLNVGLQEKPLRILSKTKIDDGRWHRIQVNRKRRVGILQVDKNKPVKGKYIKGTGILHSDGYVWIGGKPSLPSGLPSHFYYGFSGCIKRVKVFRKRLDLLRHQGDNSNLQFCETQIQSGGSVENW